LTERLRAGLQLHLSVHRKVSLPELVDLARSAVDGGITQVWVTDNLNSRNPFVALTALAGAVPIDLGMAVLVPYFHNPIEVAGAAAAVNELMDGRELSLGIARGNQSTANFIGTPQPVSFIREMAQSVKCLIAGDEVRFEDFPALSSYFHLVPSAPLRLNFSSPPSIQLYCGGNGPRSLAVGGRYMDGLIFGGTFQAVGLTGELSSLVKRFDDAAIAAGKLAPLPKVAEIKLSISRDRNTARDFVANSAGTRILSLRHRGYSDEAIARAGIAKEDLDRFESAWKRSASRDELKALVTDSMIDAIFIAGDPGYCRDRLSAVCDLARDNGFTQLMFSELGPDPNEGLRLLCRDLLPSI
jgi:alkanesulfonate monooxygenase SsuD/methylene tetrahydromethanopterin reductase-like flavin-dependent oxidoreductase (luciferase family)